jgi:hypothetical protein
MNPQRLIQRSVEHGALVAELSPQLLLLLGVGEGGRIVNAPLSRGGAAGAGIRDLDTVPSASRHHVDVPPPHKSPLLGLGEGVGKLTHWSHPGGGESSSGISTTTAREPPAGAGPRYASTRASVAASSRRNAAAAASGRVSAVAGAGWPSTTDAAGGASCATTTTGACGSSTGAGCGARGETTVCDLEASAAPCELSPAAATALAPARGALDERRWVGMDPSALNTLAGARGGTVGTTLRKHEQTVSPLLI